MSGCARPGSSPSGSAGAHASEAADPVARGSTPDRIARGSGAATAPSAAGRPPRTAWPEVGALGAADDSGPGDAGAPARARAGPVAASAEVAGAAGRTAATRSSDPASPALHPGLPLRRPRPTAARVGGAVLLFWAIVAALAPWLAPHEPSAIDFAALGAHGPSAAHPLGTDPTGRDMLSRLIWGMRTTYVVVPLATGSAFLAGGAAGLLAGWHGGWVDALVSRVGDVMLAFPALVLYVVLITTFGPSLLNVVIAVTLAYAPGVARLMRGQVLALRSRGFVEAARASGEGSLRIMAVEILPNVGAPLLTDLCLRAGYTVILVGTLGFLGLGLTPPTPDWGGMVVKGINFLSTWPHMTLLPAAAVTSVVVACNLLANGLGAGR